MTGDELAVPARRASDQSPATRVSLALELARRQWPVLAGGAVLTASVIGGAVAAAVGGNRLLRWSRQAGPIVLPPIGRDPVPTASPTREPAPPSKQQGDTVIVTAFQASWTYLVVRRRSIDHD
jgi:hypothetical protein